MALTLDPSPTLEKWMNFRKPFSPRFQRIFHYSTFSATGKSEHKIKRTIFQIKSFFFGSSSNKLCTAKLFRDGFVLISGLGENWNELLLLIVFAVSFFSRKMPATATSLLIRPTESRRRIERSEKSGLGIVFPSASCLRGRNWKIYYREDGK